VIAVLDCALNAGLVQGNQGKLNCYKEAGAKNQGKAGKEKDPFHLAHPSKGRRLQFGRSAEGGDSPRRRLIGCLRRMVRGTTGLECRRVMGM
jgi:hypothetical protein